MVNNEEALQRLQSISEHLRGFAIPTELHYRCLGSIREISHDDAKAVCAVIGVDTPSLSSNSERHEFAARVELWVHEGEWPTFGAFSRLTGLCQQQKDEHMVKFAQMFHST